MKTLDTRIKNELSNNNSLSENAEKEVRDLIKATVKPHLKESIQTLHNCIDDVTTGLEAISADVAELHRLRENIAMEQQRGETNVALTRELAYILQESMDDSQRLHET
eukprot:1672263-Rhodomonas_salina.1